MISRYQKYKASYQLYRLNNKQKANPETVKAWKQANRERCRELNRKAYKNSPKHLKSLMPKIEAPALMAHTCDCGQTAIVRKSSGWVCAGCHEIELNYSGYHREKSKTYDPFTSASSLRNEWSTL